MRCMGSQPATSNTRETRQNFPDYSIHQRPVDCRQLGGMQNSELTALDEEEVNSFIAAGH